MVELVDTLRLERSALRCAGSIPVPGTTHIYKKVKISLDFHIHITSIVDTIWKSM